MRRKTKYLAGLLCIIIGTELYAIYFDTDSLWSRSFITLRSFVNYDVINVPVRTDFSKLFGDEIELVEYPNESTIIAQRPGPFQSVTDLSLSYKLKSGQVQVGCSTHSTPPHYALFFETSWASTWPSDAYLLVLKNGTSIAKLPADFSIHDAISLKDDSLLRLLDFLVAAGFPADIEMLYQRENGSEPQHLDFMSTMGAVQPLDRPNNLKTKLFYQPKSDPWRVMQRFCKHGK